MEFWIRLTSWCTSQGRRPLLPVSKSCSSFRPQTQVFGFCLSLPVLHRLHCTCLSVSVAVLSKVWAGLDRNLGPKDRLQMKVSHLMLPKSPHSSECTPGVHNHKRKLKIHLAPNNWYTWKLTSLGFARTQAWLTANTDSHSAPVSSLCLF